MLTFSWKPDAKNGAEGIARFQKTGGLPPIGAKLAGRWIRADLGGGLDLIETTDDSKLMTEFGYPWSDPMELNDGPGVEDAELGEALKGVLT